MRVNLFERMQDMHFKVITEDGIDRWIEDAVECGFACCPECMIKIVLNPELPHSLMRHLVDSERYEDAAYLRDEGISYINRLADTKTVARYRSCGSFNEENYKGL